MKTHKTIIREWLSLRHGHMGVAVNAAIRGFSRLVELGVRSVSREANTLLNRCGYQIPPPYPGRGVILTGDQCNNAENKF